MRWMLQKKSISSGGRGELTDEEFAIFESVRDRTPAALWPQMEPGSALVTVMKIKKSETAEAGGPKPVLEATRAEIRCGLYLK